MSKPHILSLFCCVAALPLLGCANGAGVGPRAQAAAPPALAAANAAGPAGVRVYAAGSGAPAAILAMMPGPGNILTTDPALWAEQGFDIVAPPPEPFRLADETAAVDRLIVMAREMADAPIWLVGPNPAIEAAMAGAPIAGPGQISGVVVTSVASGTGTCSERMVYSYSGNGAAPKVAVSKSGDACPPGAPFGVDTNQGVAPMSPAVRPYAPRLIQASTSGGGATASSRQAAVQRVAELIKAGAAD